MNSRNGEGRHPVDKGRVGVTKQAKVTPGQKAVNPRIRARLWVDWLRPLGILIAATVALVSDGALFHESSQLVAVVVLLLSGLVLIVRDWSRIHMFLGSRLGLLAIVNGAVLVISAILSVYRWASLRELLKAAALAEAFLLGATLIDREALRDRFLVMFYWWSIAAAGAGSVLYLAGMRWPAERAGELRATDTCDVWKPSQRVLRVCQCFCLIPAGPDSAGGCIGMARRAQRHCSAGRARRPAGCHAVDHLAVGVCRPWSGTRHDAYPGAASGSSGWVPAHACGHCH